ncbi:MAG TPA: ABC transporter substrate-binding protein [Acidimicrobiia bacterium]|nr:ABC transporter substrate-binding protein [Acidimicrobiia bacterium]
MGLALMAAACGGDQKHSNSALPKAADTPAAAPSADTPAADSATAAPTETPAADSAAPAASAEAPPVAANGATPAAATARSNAPASRTAAGTASAPSGTPGAPGTPAPNTPSAPTPGGAGSGVVGTPAAPTGNGGATDTGVSATEIKLGTISDNGAPLGNIVTIPVVTTVIGMMRAVNDTGGIYGRKVVVQDCDSAGDLTRFRACFKKLVEEEKVFSFITSITWGTGEVHADLAKAKIPWFGSWGFFTSEWKDPWMFPAHMASVHEAHANSLYLRDVFHVKTVGILYLNIPEDRAAVKAMHDVFDPAGIKVVKEIPLEVEDPNETANVVAMRSANPDQVVHFAWSPPMVKWMLGAHDQGYWPPMGVSGNHFAADALGPLVGDWPLKGMWTITSYKVWSDNPEYLAVMAKYAPEMKTKIHHITQTAYAGSRVWISTAKEVGPNLTREKMMDMWESRPWDGGPGMGVTFTWRPTAKAARNGQGGDPAGHDTERCEYQFKYNKSQAGDYKVWVPAPERYDICDTID